MKLNWGSFEGKDKQATNQKAFNVKTEVQRASIQCEFKAVSTFQIAAINNNVITGHF